MKKPIILMTGGSEIGNLDQVRLYNNKNYSEALEAQGAIVLSVCDSDPGTVAQLTALADGLFLTGGVDIEPARYGEETLPECGRLDLWRDETEFAFAKAFVEAKKPILGVCRGLQTLNVALGGTLYQDLPSQLGLPHGNGTIHEIENAPGSELYEFYGPRCLTNSYHHQAVKDLAPGLEITATSEEGRVVEAFRHRELPIVAYQFHPERMRGENRVTAEGPDTDPLFKYFADLCR